MQFEQGLSFDDVLLRPRFSPVSSRSEVNLQTNLTKEIKLNIPVISANMDAVTESEMAIAMARQGGLGIIHRFLTITQQAQEIIKVKRAESLLIEHPYSVKPTQTVHEIKQLRKELGVSGFLVTNDNQELLGLVSARDMRFIENGTTVQDIMTKRQDLIVAQPTVTKAQAKQLLQKNKIEKLPIVNEFNKIKGMITSTDMRKEHLYPNASKDSKGRLLVGAAVGVKADVAERTEALLAAGADIIVIDIAHGHSKAEVETIRNLKGSFDVQLMAGNVATAQGAKDLIAAGADCIKTGVGPGSVCSTRIVTGCGVPQLSAVLETAEVGKQYNIPIIADGGIKNSGDITKAIAAGASAVMLGNLLGGTDEAPGDVRIKNGRRYKVYRGMASLAANMSKKLHDKEEPNINEYVAEGVKGEVPYRGSAKEVLQQLMGGLRSGMSYCGVTNVNDLKNYKGFIKITASGMRESKPHDVQLS